MQLGEDLLCIHKEKLLLSNSTGIIEFKTAVTQTITSTIHLGIYENMMKGTH